jgi:arabinose-5-phosphate isomerase
MHSAEELPTCSLDCPMAEAILIMTAKRFGCVGVVDDSGTLEGIITDGDLRRHMDNDLLGQRAGDVMTGGPKSIRPQALAVEALRMMNMTNRPITSLFVVEGEQPVGIVHIHDCLRSGVA